MRWPARARDVFLAMAASSVCMASSAESLSEAWQMGLSRNMEFAAVAAEAESARAAESAARAERWPSLTAAASYTQFDSAPQLDIVSAGMAMSAADSEAAARSGLRMAYNRLVGESSERTPELDAVLPIERALSEQPLDRLMQSALNSRSEISALGAQADALSLQSDAQRALLLPQLALSGGYTYVENEILDRQSLAAVGIGLDEALSLLALERAVGEL